MAPVASALARRASATFPPASRSAMMPEPMTVANSRKLPVASASKRRAFVLIMGVRSAPRVFQHPGP